MKQNKIKIKNQEGKHITEQDPQGLQWYDETDFKKKT